MRSTKPDSQLWPYLGIDLTDRYAKTPRPIDVCGLRPESTGGCVVDFWQWTWDDDPSPLDVVPLTNELAPGVLALIDGPMALAVPPNAVRECERIARAVGRTGSVLPDSSARVPFAGFIRSSIDLFDALDAAGIPLLSSADPELGRAGEVYPGDLWAHLVRSLAKKTTRAGWEGRKTILGCLGVRFGNALKPGNHDRLDACIGAVVAAALRGAIPGLSASPVGVPLARADGILREGEMWRLVVESAEIRAKIAEAIGGRTPSPVPLRRKDISSPPSASG